MPNPRVCLYLAVALVWAWPVCAAEPPGSPEPIAPRILVGPELLASRDGDFPHVEPIVAAHPRDPKVLLGAAMTRPRFDAGIACKAYASRDGGSLWRPVELEQMVEHGLGDPIVAFTPRETALFGCLIEIESETGRSRAALAVYRSEDGGVTWEGPAMMAEQSWDHPMMTVDSTSGRHAGNVYVGVLYGWEATLGVMRSEDDGRSFVGPVEVAHAPENGLLVAGLEVLSDGTLAFVYVETPAGAWAGSEPYEQTLWVATSADGGVTFSAPRRVATRVAAASDEAVFSTRLGTVAVTTADRSATTTRDRLYVAWNDYRSGSWRVHVAVSADGGASWSEPVAVDPAAPEDSHQLLPALAVDRAGTLGISYADTRGFAEADGFGQRFTASVDGGATFLPSREISAAPSRPLGVADNERPVLQTFDDGTGHRLVSLLSIAGRWPQGGDYLGLAAAAGGDFHPLYASARGGPFQLWTTRIRVERPAPEPLTERSPPPPFPMPPRPEPEASNVTRQVELVADRIERDPETGELIVPIRLHNLGDRPIHPPIVVEVIPSGLMESLADQPPEVQERWRRRQARFLNPDGEVDGRPRFDYGELLGDFETLEPGAMTAARPWRIKSGSQTIASIRVRVTGRVR